MVKEEEEEEEEAPAAVEYVRPKTAEAVVLRQAPPRVVCNSCL